MNYQWYPGHMTKAIRMMQENIKLIDLVIELVDARIPISSRNPDIDTLGKNKYRLVLLNKADLGDPACNHAWAAYFHEKGIAVLEINARTGDGCRTVTGAVREVCREKLERDRRRGIVNRPIRAMVVGIPNVGKSTFINSLAGRACAKTGNKPGVTKGKQWIRLSKELELLDTPGILWPKFEDREVGMRLAFIGSMNDEILIPDELACDLIGCVQRLYPGALAARYGVEPPAQEFAACEAADVLAQIAVRRGCLAAGGEPDLPKAAGLVIDDFRSGRLGRMTLERTEDYE